MRFLFVHQNFPGQFLHLVRHLLREGDHEVVFIAEGNENNIPGVRKLAYTPPPIRPDTFADAREIEQCLARARIVQEMASRLDGLGFRPDIVIGHHGWGELLNIQDVWPGVPLLGYFEFFYHQAGFDLGFDPEMPMQENGHGALRAKNAVNFLALSNPGHGQTPTEFQLSTYPDWARRRITVLHEGVDTAVAAPNPAIRQAVIDLPGFRIEPGDILVTFVARDLEPYRGFHTMMRAIPALQRLSPRLKIVLVGGDGVSYGARLVNDTWRAFLLREQEGRIDPARICFPGRVEYTTFLHLLQRSDVHVYLTYPFVLSWSLREALACGCALVASDTAPVREFVRDGETGLMVDMIGPEGVVAGVTRLLENPAEAARLRANAREWALRHLDMPTYLANYRTLVRQVVESSR